MQTDDVISTADAADIMCVSQTWVGNMIDEGTPEGVRLHSRGVPVSWKSAFKNTLAQAAKRGTKSLGLSRSGAA